MIVRSLVLTILLSLTSSLVRVLAEGTVEISLDGEWDFTYTRASALNIPDLPTSFAFDAKVKVPGYWDDQLDRFKGTKWWSGAEFMTRISPVQYLSGIGWYRKVIDVPTVWVARASLLTIGWAVGVTNVWLDRTHIGTYDYGVYTPYTLDLTNHLKAGKKNELIIAVDNTKGFAGGSAFLGYVGKASGISRPVTLKVTGGPGRITDVYVRQDSDQKEITWQVDLEVPTAGYTAPHSKLFWDVREADKCTVLAHGSVDVLSFANHHRLEWKAHLTSQNTEIKSWSPAQPNLYWTRLRWVTVNDELWDTLDQRFGLRRWTHEGRKLELNGSPIYLRGEHGAYYFPVQCSTPTSKEYWREHINRAKQLGMNFINFAGRVCPIELMEAADELGMILQCGDYMTVLKPYRDFYKEVWTPILLWTRNHPSMCIYGFDGEIEYYEGIIDQFKRQYDLIKSLNPESMVMPQQAIRGIDYAFDERGSKELTLKPFPHHAERLAQYAKASDLFGHHSSGAFGYNYFDTPWQEMEQRFVIYNHPLIAHELFMGTSYLNPMNAKKYTGRIPPYLYSKLESDLAHAGLSDKWLIYYNNSSRLQSICRKYCVEKTRKCGDLSGYELLGLTDQHAIMPHYTTGILDEFLELKPGETVPAILRYNNENVLLLDFAGQSINRSYWAGDTFEADVMISLYGDVPLHEGKLMWVIKEDEEILFKNEAMISDVPNGSVTKLDTIKFSWPSIAKTKRLNLSVKAMALGDEIINDWDFWVFPKVTAPEVVADADASCLNLLAPRYKRLVQLSKKSNHKLRVVSELSGSEIEHMERGGDVLLLGNKPFPIHTAYRSFRPGLGGRHISDVGTVISKHPIFESLPNEGWGDWQFYPILEGTPAVLFDNLKTKFDPILEIISSASQVRKQASIFEKRVGQSRLFVSTCVIDLTNPSCVALMDSILRYVQSERFRPESELSATALTGLLDPLKPLNDNSEKPEATITLAKSWYKEAQTLHFKSKVWFRINQGHWNLGSEVRITQEGINKVQIRNSENDKTYKTHEVRIDVTPPTIKLVTNPIIDQEGGLYFATQATVFAIEAHDELSGVKTVEISTDGINFTPYREPFKLAPGRYEIKCRAIDVAGNRNTFITYRPVSSDNKEVIEIEVR